METPRGTKKGARDRKTDDRALPLSGLLSIDLTLPLHKTKESHSVFHGNLYILKMFAYVFIFSKLAISGSLAICYIRPWWPGFWTSLLLLQHGTTIEYPSLARSDHFRDGRTTLYLIQLCNLKFSSLWKTQIP